MGPLDGYRVLDLSHAAAGPWCTSLLGDMGADVIKIEPPDRGDMMRYLDHVFPGADSGYFIGVNRNKRGITLDLRWSEGQEIFYQLLQNADVVVENYRDGVAERLGVDYESVRRAKPDVVYCSIRAWGHEGPLKDKPGVDVLLQAFGGVMGLTGEPGQPPVKVGPPIGDFIGTYLACYGITLALLTRQKYGIGQRVDINLLDGMVASLANFMTSFFVTGKPDKPVGRGHPQLVPLGAYATQDTFIIIACMTERFWANLCSVLGLEHLMTDPRFRTNPDRTVHVDELIPILEGVLQTRSADYWIELFDANDVPATKVNSLADLLNHPQVHANHMVAELDHPKAGRIKVPGVPITLSETPGSVRTPAPGLGEHTEQILNELGLSKASIADLKAKRII